ncbi:MAG: MBL fold metallo-hydrolase [Armatimonadetes bacterium]|nr:MBL fold metallo-hydrolase [Armatimonadota bacterium]
MSASLVVLGSSGAVQTAHRDNAALAFRMEESSVLVDCPGSVFLKLRKAGLDPMLLRAVVITHAHPDHIYGLPSLVHHLWMLARQEPLPLFAPEPEIGKLRGLLDVFDLGRRAEFLEMHPLAAGATSPTGDAAGPFWEHAGGRLSALPSDHGPPAFAIRWDTPAGARVVYSSDTRPVEAMASFGRDAALFVHEATFLESEAIRAAEGGHSTAAQAARLAALAGARRLLLVHLDYRADAAQWVEEARSEFVGPVEVPDDGAIYAVE